MTGTARLRTVAAVATVATAALTATALVPAPAAAAARRVTVTVQIDDCEGCVIKAYNTLRSPRSMFVRSAQVSGGVARFLVPAAKTSGMSFDVTTPDDAGALGAPAVPVIAMGFAGYDRRSTLTLEQALARGQKANGCWAGTNRDTTIEVSTYRFTVEDPEPYEAEKGAYFWASPTQSTFNDAQNMHSSRAMGHQDAPYCTR